MSWLFDPDIESLRMIACSGPGDFARLIVLVDSTPREWEEAPPDEEPSPREDAPPSARLPILGRLLQARAAPAAER